MSKKGTMGKFVVQAVGFLPAAVQLKIAATMLTASVGMGVTIILVKKFVDIRLVAVSCG